VLEKYIYYQFDRTAGEGSWIRSKFCRLVVLNTRARELLLLRLTTQTPAISPHATLHLIDLRSFSSHLHLPWPVRPFF